MFSRSLDTLTDERVNFYPVFMEEDELSEIPIEEESFIHCDCCPLCEERYNIEMTDDGWQCRECEHVWTDTDDGLGDDEPVDEIQPEVPGDWASDTTTRPITHIQTPEETAWAINLLRQYGCTFPNFTRSDDSEVEG
jgi:hypothetical protein